MQDALVRIQGISRVNFQKVLPGDRQVSTTATPGNDQGRCCYGLSTELALQSGVGIGQKVIDVSA